MSDPRAWIQSDSYAVRVLWGSCRLYDLNCHSSLGGIVLLGAFSIGVRVLLLIYSSESGLSPQQGQEELPGRDPPAEAVIQQLPPPNNLGRPFASLMSVLVFFVGSLFLSGEWILCCNKVKLSPWKVPVIHANPPRFMRMSLPLSPPFPHLFPSPRPLLPPSLPPS